VPGDATAGRQPRKDPTVFSLINRLVGVVDDPADTDRIRARLEAAGIPAEDIEVLVGREGAIRLDSTVGGGWRQRVVRLTQYLVTDQSTEYVMQDAALRDGRALVAVLLRDRSRKSAATRCSRRRVRTSSASSDAS
jgi:hypothetical protein